jgi:hypothetical protein
MFSSPSLDKGAPKSEAKKIIGVRKFQNSQFFFNTPETFQRMKYKRIFFNLTKFSA